MNQEINFDIKVPANEIKEIITVEDKKTCAALVHQKMQERNEDIDELYTIIDDSESTQDQIDEAISTLDEMILGIDKFDVVKIHLSTGGPADWIEVELDDEKYIRRMTYHYSDWFDHAETKIYDDSYLWEFAARIIENY